MNESELYKELGALTDDKDGWQESIPYVSSLLAHESVKIQAKSLWLLGEMGLVYPLSVQDAVPAIASFLNSREPLLRERAVNALGRIGRGSMRIICRYSKNSCMTRMTRYVLKTADLFLPMGPDGSDSQYMAAPPSKKIM